MAFNPTKVQPPGELMEEIAREVRAGLYASTKSELQSYQTALDYMELRNQQHMERREAEELRDFLARPKQFSHVTRKAIRTLGRLYAPGPERTLEAEGLAGDFLIELIYRKQRINAILQRVDQLATLHGVCAVQPVPTGKPDDPIRLDVWGRNEFVPYFNDDDYRQPHAVVTKAVQYRGNKFRRQYRIWSAQRIETYYTDWLTMDFFTEAVWSGTQAVLSAEESGANPYGVLPFAFFFNAMPVDRFDGSGIGTALAHANGEADRMLSDLAEILTVFLAPKMVGTNLSASFRWRDRTDGIILLPERTPQDEGGKPPEITFLQPSLDVEQAWLHLEKYLNQVFEDLDVPIKAVRGESHWEQSGIAIVVSQAPLLQYLRDRQVPFGSYEQDLASLVLKIAGAWYQQPELLNAVEAELTLSWPPVSIPIPSQEVDATYEAGIRMGIDSPITVLMKRDGLTRAQAEERMAEIDKDNEEWGPDDVYMQQGEGQGQGQDEQGDEGDPEDDENAPEDEGKG